MPKNNNIHEIATGAIVANPVVLPTNEGVSLYLITGDASFTEATENLVISPDGPAVVGMQYTFSKPANITVGTFGLDIFGRVLTLTEASEPALITCIYNGASWDVYLAN